MGGVRDHDGIWEGSAQRLSSLCNCLYICAYTMNAAGQNLSAQSRAGWDLGHVVLDEKSMHLSLLSRI